jgi:AcrR family transcriptional regulator
MVDSSKEVETREQIMEAARQVFMEKGLNGARMQEIADRAGINKALLHYYFTSKQNLFDQIFNEAFSQFWPNVAPHLKPETTFHELLKIIINIYINILKDNPSIPLFILSELHNNPDKLELRLRSTGIEFEKILFWFKSEIEKGNIYAIQPQEMMVNIIALCVFPFAGRPILQRVWYNNDSNAYDQFLESRASTLFSFIERALFTPQYLQTIKNNRP